MMKIRMKNPTIKKIKARRKRSGIFGCLEENYAGDIKSQLLPHEAEQFLGCGVCKKAWRLPCLRTVKSVATARKCLQNLLAEYAFLNKKQFEYIVKNKFIAPLCENLFFCYIQDDKQDMFVIHDGVPHDMQNNPLEFADNAMFKLMHPIDVTAKYDYIFRLEIEQPIEQIHLPFFEPSNEDRTYNYVSRYEGALITQYSLRKRLKREGFLISNKYGFASKKINDVLCVLDYTWTMGSPKMGLLGRVCFYDANTYKRVANRQEMIKMQIRDIEPWVFSEFMRRIGLCIR
ncbi:MAG: DUF4132 domain-containing protein [Firmicutes bacterium]|nr:DUF4132 domain-containing protein [Bacillota bacterium]